MAGAGKKRGRPSKKAGALAPAGGALYAPSGGSLGKRPPKGSPQMKEYMRKLRSMRKKGKT
jgi:hypothetical protein